MGSERPLPGWDKLCSAETCSYVLMRTFENRVICLLSLTEHTSEQWTRRRSVINHCYLAVERHPSAQVLLQIAMV